MSSPGDNYEQAFSVFLAMNISLVVRLWINCDCAFTSDNILKSKDEEIQR
jgi:hypothetical protein